METFGQGNYDPTLVWADDELVVGDELYLEIIRPELMRAGILPKTEKLKKEAKSKGSKKEKSMKYNEMRRKIATDRLKKDIGYMMESFSFERLNIEVGLHMKKIELKLVTFLYICIFFARNRKQMDKQVQQVFELIFVLAKLLRLVDGLQKEAFYDESLKIEVSPSCVKDLRDCVRALSEHYEYSINEVLLEHPKLIYHTSYDRYF